MSSSFDILKTKLNNFVKKYYKNLIIKGFILSFSLIILLFIVVTFFEYLSWSDTLTRTIIYYLFMVAAVIIIVYYMIIPALKLIKLGKVLSHEDAARIIGNHFPEVSDKLINTLQLHDNSSTQSVELLMAGIEQKSNELTPVPFRKAVLYKTNVKYLKFIIPPLLIVLITLIVSPATIFGPTERIINHNTNYIKPLPYSLTLLNTEFNCAQREDFIVTVSVSGEEIPSKIWINESGFNYRMAEVKPSVYEYVFKDVLSDIYFTVATHDFASDKYHITVLPQPIIFNFDVDLDYPSYLQKQNEKIENIGDLIVPEGTLINWNYYTRDTRNISFIIGESNNILSGDESNVFRTSVTARNDFGYKLVASNEFMTSKDSLLFDVQVIKDEYPIIAVNEYKDDQNYGMVNFSGTVSDDHGFLSLSFLYRKDSIPELPWNKEELLIDRNISQQNFDYMLMASDFGLQPGDALNYYFEIRDNDAFNGYKRAKSQMYYFMMPDATELENKIENSSNELKSRLNESLKEIDQLDKQIEDIRLNLFEKKDLSWSDKQQLSDLLKKEENIKNQLEEIQKLNEDIKELEDLLKKKMSPELEEKLKQLQELFNELFNKDLEEELKKLKEELEKENISDFLEKMKQQNEDLKSDLEQNLELYKQMEFEQMIQESIEELNKLAEEEKALSEETAKKESSKEQSKEKQAEVQEKFSDLLEKLDKASELNKELEDPYNVEVDTSLSSEIGDQMEEAQENIQKGKEKKASENQQDAGGKMEDMANGLSVMMESAMEERMGEDIDLIKNMLDNLLDLSFAQENIIEEINKISKNDPKTVDIRERQKGLKDDFEIINDSLMSMSKRQAAIKPFVVKESGKINSHIQKALGDLHDQNLGKAAGEQQYAMTSMNNLSLMLAESLEQMQQSMMQMKGSKKGGSKCKNPGQGNSPSMSEIMNQQEGMGKGMKGKMQQKGKDGLNKDSEELARMAATQGEIRRMLQEFIEQLEAEGGNGSALNKIVEEMKKSEEDIINRRLTLQTLERQKQIETRLLKSQKALQEREKEKKRESKEGKNRNSGNQNNKKEYKTTKENQEEILITNPIEVRPYYRKLLKEYLYKLEKEKNKEDGK